MFIEAKYKCYDISDHNWYLKFLWCIPNCTFLYAFQVTNCVNCSFSLSIWPIGFGLCEWISKVQTVYVSRIRWPSCSKMSYSSCGLKVHSFKPHTHCFAFRLCFINAEIFSLVCWLLGRKNFSQWINLWQNLSFTRYQKRVTNIHIVCSIF